MNITNSIVNNIGTPGAYTNTFSNRPGASVVPTGTLYFSNDTNVLYQSTGSTWINYSGSATTPTLQQVLTAGNTATDNIYLTNAGNAFRLYTSNINNQTYFTYEVLGSAGTNNGFISFYQAQGNEIRTGDSSQAGGFYQGMRLDFDFSQYYLGDWNNFQNGTKIVIDDVTNEITLQQDNLFLNGAITSGTSTGNSGQHLVLTINGTGYKIKLENP